MNIGIIGVGNIGKIFLEKSIQSNGLEIDRVNICDLSKEKVREYLGEVFVNFYEKPKDLCENSDIILTAVKPQDAGELLDQIKDIDFSNKVIISPMTGITIDKISKVTGAKNIARIMPNIPAAIGKGVTGICFSREFDSSFNKATLGIIETLGKSVTIKEKDFPAVTALSGSGPAFVFVIVESLIDVGLKMGLSYDKSRELILETLKGSIDLLEEKGNHPGEFRHLVTSPAGTTIEGIYSLEREGLRGTIMKVIFDTYLRAKELNEIAGK